MPQAIMFGNTLAAGVACCWQLSPSPYGPEFLHIRYQGTSVPGISCEQESKRAPYNQPFPEEMSK